MNIIVIGNGFDIAHGLKTKYKDFLDFCKNIFNEKSIDYEYNFKHFSETNLWLKHFITKQDQLGNTWIDLENEIFEIIKYIKDLPIVGGVGANSKTCPQCLTIYHKFLDFDFKKISDNKYLEKECTEVDTKSKEYLLDTVCGTDKMSCVHIKTAQGFINFLYDQLREFTYAFNEYLREVVLSELDTNVHNYEIPKLRYSTTSDGHYTYLLSFNYTDTFERLYKHHHLSKYPTSIKSFYIHGKVSNQKDCNFVFGTKTFDNTTTYGQWKRTINTNFNVFRKHNQRHKLGTVEVYQNLLSELKSERYRYEIPVFHVIGHSLDITDHGILGHLFSFNENAIINIYYHNQESQERLINNITDMIGEKSVLTRVRLIYQHDEKRGILKPINLESLTCSKK